MHWNVERQIEGLCKKACNVFLRHIIAACWFCMTTEKRRKSLMEGWQPGSQY